MGREGTAPNLTEEHAAVRAVDPVTRGIQYGIAFLIICVLTVVIYGVLTGLVNPPAPRTRPEAVATLMAASIKEHPGNGKAWADYAEALYASGDKAKAFETLAQARKRVKDKTINEVNTAEVHLLLLEGRDKDALARSTKYIQKAIDLRDEEYLANKKKGIVIPYDRQDNVSLINMFTLRATAESNLEDYKAAEVDYTNALKLEPQAADIMVMRGWVRLRGGNKTGAEEDFNNALQFLPNDPEATRGLRAARSAETTKSK